MDSGIRPGSTIRNGDIKILNRLGLGGFGEVFLAQTNSGLKAVKVVDTATWSEKEYQVFNTMLMTEASFLSTLRHEALPRSAGFFAEGSRYFLVMDWVQGQTLEQFVELEGPLGLDDCFALVGTLTDILEYLHQKCEQVVVFGDLKPANILRVGPGSYRLVDLGLVSYQGARFSRRIAVFSPNYSAPERAQGGASHPLNDIYSLGATIFFALTGKVPTPQMSGKERERYIRDRLSRSLDGWGEASVHCLKKLLILVLASMEPDPDGRPRGIRHFREAWRRTDEVRKKELEGSEKGRVDEIVRLLYEKN